MFSHYPFRLLPRAATPIGSPVSLNPRPWVTRNITVRKCGDNQISNFTRRLEFVVSGSRDQDPLQRAHRGGSWEKTKDDDSEVGGEKNLVDDTRFLRRWVLRHCLFLLPVPVLSFPPVRLLCFNAFRLEMPAFLPPRGIRRC